MNNVKLNELADAFARAQAKQTTIVSTLLGEISALNQRDAERSAAFDRLTKGDAETMAVTPQERNFIERARSGTVLVIGVPNREAAASTAMLIAAIVGKDFLNAADVCDCPNCTEAREAKH